MFRDFLGNKGEGSYPVGLSFLPLSMSMWPVGLSYLPQLSMPPTPKPTPPRNDDAAASRPPKPAPTLPIVLSPTLSPAESSLAPTLTPVGPPPSMLLPTCPPTSSTDRAQPPGATAAEDNGTSTGNRDTSPSSSSSAAKLAPGAIVGVVAAVLGAAVVVALVVKRRSDAAARRRRQRSRLQLENLATSGSVTSNDSREEAFETDGTPPHRSSQDPPTPSGAASV